MSTKLFHIFRNTPLGRETLLQSIYFCRAVGSTIDIYIPESLHFLLYFENNVTQIDLDSSYLNSPKTAKSNAKDLLTQAELPATFFRPKNYTASTLPDIPTNYDFMCCPRSISDLSSKIGLGYIGPRVRNIVQSARFPVLVTSTVFKPWKSITVFYGGSANSNNAMRLGLRICKSTGMPLTIFTQAENLKQKDYAKLLKKAKLETELEQINYNWLFFDSGNIEDNLYSVAHDTLIILGAYGHGLIKDLMFGSKMEKIQAIMPNNLLIVGPRYSSRL